jgi:putative transposase
MGPGEKKGPTSPLIFTMDVINYEQQILEILKTQKEQPVKVAYILSQLDLSSFDKKEYVKFTISSIARLYAFRLIRGFRNYGDALDYLNKNQTEAFMLGFYRHKDNSLELPSKRTFNNYLKNSLTSEQKLELKSISEKILSIATKEKVSLDIEVVNNVKENNYEKYRKKMFEAIRIVKRLAYSHINIKTAKNAIFTGKDMLDVLVWVAFNHGFANGSSKCIKASKELQRMHPTERVPSGDTLLYHFSKFNSIVEIRSIFYDVLDSIFLFAKRNYKLLEYGKFDIAYDLHKLPYYGKGIPYAKGGEFERGTSNFLYFLTCSIVEKGRRFVLDVVPVSPIDDISCLLSISLSHVKRKIKVNNVYLDRGFNSAKIINVLNRSKVKFLMPMVRNASVKKAFDKAQYCKSRVFRNFNVGSEKVNLILVDDKEGIKRAFISNFDVAPQYAHRLFEMYSKRWGIETCYRQLDHNFLPRTTSRNYNIRLFYFLFSCCLHNTWVLVNVCASLVIYGRVNEKPIIDSKLFALVLYGTYFFYFGNKS